MSYPMNHRAWWWWRPSWGIMQSDGWYCPSCGEVVKPDRHSSIGYGSHCGGRVETKCPKCGVRLVEASPMYHDRGCSVRPPTSRWEVGFQGRVPKADQTPIGGADFAAQVRYGTR